MLLPSISNTKISHGPCFVVRQVLAESAITADDILSVRGLISLWLQSDQLIISSRLGGSLFRMLMSDEGIPDQEISTANTVQHSGPTNRSIC